MSNGSPAGDDVIVASTSGPLGGEVTVPGAKNSVLKLMAATLLADGRHLLTNVPVIDDVTIMADLLRAVGLRIERIAAPAGEVGQHLEIVNTGAITPVAPFEVADRIRASVNLVGPLLTRFGHIDIALPGGGRGTAWCRRPSADPTERCGTTRSVLTTQPTGSGPWMSRVRR
ncbi:MAG: hypothetical protein EBS48_10665, partial [Actinobacteria bacterium]|nr:hypothetical protein [Actinomycetota bacterium]